MNTQTLKKYIPILIPAGAMVLIAAGVLIFILTRGQTSQPVAEKSSSVPYVSSVAEEVSSPEPESSQPPVPSAQSVTASSKKPESKKPETVYSRPQNTTIRQEDLTEYPALTLEQLNGLDSLNNKKSGWGPGHHAIGVRPGMTKAINESFAQYDGYYVHKDEKKIYLTFDCGYENGYTPKILDALWEADVKAVFFVTMPYVKENPKIVERMLNEGHIVGNHSVNHPSMPSKDLAGVFHEIADLDKYMLDNFKYKMKYFRPPMGEYSDRTLAITQALNYKSIFWSFAYVDWEQDKQPTKAKALEMITTHSHPGAIYLLHAVSKANAEALYDSIKELQRQGYTLALLDV